MSKTSAMAQDAQINLEERIEELAEVCAKGGTEKDRQVLAELEAEHARQFDTP